MIKKLKYILLVIYNLIRFRLLYIVTLKRINVGFIQLINLKSKLKIEGRNAEIKIGQSHILENTLLQANEGKIFIGNKVFINRNCNIISLKKIVIDDGTTIGPNVCIYDHDHVFNKSNNQSELFKTEEIIIGKNVWIGCGVIILKGVTIGNNCVIGAGTIISKNIPDDTLVVNKNELVMKKI